MPPEMIDRLAALMGLVFCGYVALHAGRYARECVRDTAGWVWTAVISFLLLAFLMFFLGPSPTARGLTFAVCVILFAYGIWDENRHRQKLGEDG